MNLDFNFSFINLDGAEIPNSNAGNLIATTLASASKGDSLKLWHWANKLYKGEVLELDPSDTQVLKTFIENAEGITVLARAQCLKVFII